MTEETSQSTEQPLELILARNLVSIISLPAFLVDVDGQMIFYNDAAGGVIGSPFEEIGSMPRDEWNARFGPFDENGDQLSSEELPLTIALREGHPAYGRFRVRTDTGLIEIETGALPLIGPAGFHGALIVFWVPSENGSGAS